MRILSRNQFAMSNFSRDGIDFGTRVEVVYERGKRGNIRLKSIQRTE